MLFVYGKIVVIHGPFPDRYFTRNNFATQVMTHDSLLDVRSAETETIDSSDPVTHPVYHCTVANRSGKLNLRNRNTNKPEIYQLLVRFILSVDYQLLERT